MRRSARRVVVVLVLALLGFGVLPAQAVIPDPFEPIKIAILIQIADRLQTVYKTLAAVNDKVKSTRNRLEMMFPNETMAPILTVFGQVQSIKDEITKLSCAWRFSPRTESMRLGMLKLGPLCRDQIHRMFGAPLPGLDRDLQEMRQWQGAIRYNMVKESIAISPSWTAAAQQLGRDARAGGASNDPNNPASVGRSMRLLAQAEALQLQVAARDNAIEAMRLDGLQEELDGERREDWHRQNAFLVGTEWMGSYQKQVGATPRVGAAAMTAGLK